MKEVVRTEILKLLEAGIIYPIADSRWVSHVHCVPKKGGISIDSFLNKDDNNEMYIYINENLNKGTIGEIHSLNKKFYLS